MPSSKIHRQPLCAVRRDLDHATEVSDLFEQSMRNCRLLSVSGVVNQRQEAQEHKGEVSRVLLLILHQLSHAGCYGCYTL
eukprot:5777665-Pleurochrysis_carterae.AAC.2